MTHPMQKQRAQRINKVKRWYQEGMSIRGIINQAIMEFDCTTEKALEYLSEVIRE